MTLRRIQLSIVVVVLFILFVIPGVARPTPASWTFEGCWTQFQTGPCRDIYRDPQGQAWICRDCGTTRNPGPGKCNQISDATLNSGFWCS